MTKGKLYIVATPIGNLEEFSNRAINTLNKVAFIFAEDTRHSKILLDMFGIKTPLYSLYEKNMIVKSSYIISLLKNGNDIAIISDAGMPLISDPGYEITRLIKNDFDIIPISGPCALINALTASCLPTNPFIFLGFLPRKNKEEILKKYQFIKATMIFYESPNRLKETLKTLCDIYDEFKCSIARELTKVYETFYYYDTKKELLDNLDNILEKGEFVIVIYKEENKIHNDISFNEHLNYYVNKGYNYKESLKKVSADLNVSKKELYKNIIKQEEN